MLALLPHVVMDKLAACCLEINLVAAQHPMHAAAPIKPIAVLKENAFALAIHALRVELMDNASPTPAWTSQNRHLFCTLFDEQWKSFMLEVQ